MMGSIGLLGCGQLGGAMAQALLRTGTVTQSRLWICNRSGPVAALRAYQVNWTREPQELAEHCETLLLALPPSAGGHSKARRTRSSGDLGDGRIDAG